jgi:hypothetical protein
MVMRTLCDRQLHFRQPQARGAGCRS